MSESSINVETLMLKEISSHSVLSREDERALFVEYETASQKRKDKIKVMLINANMRFVLQVALSYTKKMAVELTELVSEGKMGLLTAIDLFDYRTENKFISFAVWHIKCKISKYLETRDLIRLPSHQKVKLNRAKKESTYDNVDEHTRYLWEVTNAPLSFDSPVSTDDGGNSFTLGDIIEDSSFQHPETVHYRNNLVKLVSGIIEDTLDEDEIEVLSTLYGLADNDISTLRKTRDIVGKSHERVRQIRDGAFRKLRKNNRLRDIRNVFCDII